MSKQIEDSFTNLYRIFLLTSKVPPVKGQFNDTGEQKLRRNLL